MKIKPVASSSKGNAYLVSDGTTTILLECGLPLKDLKRRTNFTVPSEIAACLVTHCHNDHAKSLKDMLNAGVDCYALKDTFESKGVTEHHRAKNIEINKLYTVGTFNFITLEMKHDVPCVGFLIHSKETGERLLLDLDYIMIEANYDVRLVEDDALKNRLFKSHMSIDTTVNYLKSIDISRVKTIYLLHLSSRHSNEVDFKKRVQAATGKPVVVCEE